MGYRNYSHADVSQPKMLQVLILRVASSFAARKSWELSLLHLRAQHILCHTYCILQGQIPAFFL